MCDGIPSILLDSANCTGVQAVRSINLNCVFLVRVDNGGSVASKKYRVLHVEDDDFQRELLSKNLEDFCATEGCGTVAEALNLINPVFDLVICDFHFSVSSGLEVAAVAAKYSIPILILSAKVGINELCEFVNMGTPIRSLTKPCAPARIRAIVRELLVSSHPNNKLEAIGFREGLKSSAFLC